MKKKPTTKAGKAKKINKVMSEYERGSLKSGSGKKVKNKKQAVAIAMSEAGKKKKTTKKKRY